MLPKNITPTEVGELTGQKFGWNQEKVINSEQYVKGVTAGYDFARRELLDELTEYFKEQPKTAEDAKQRWGVMKDWVITQPRPDTPDQPFED